MYRHIHRTDTHKLGIKHFFLHTDVNESKFRLDQPSVLVFFRWDSSPPWQTEAGCVFDPEVELMCVYESENESASVPGSSGLSEWPVRASRSSWSGVQELRSSTEVPFSLTSNVFSWARPSLVSGGFTWSTFGRLKFYYNSQTFAFINPIWSFS